MRALKRNLLKKSKKRRKRGRRTKRRKKRKRRRRRPRRRSMRTILMGVGAGRWISAKRRRKRRKKTNLRKGLRRRPQRAQGRKAQARRARLSLRARSQRNPTLLPTPKAKKAGFRLQPKKEEIPSLRRPLLTSWATSRTNSSPPSGRHSKKQSKT